MAWAERSEGGLVTETAPALLNSIRLHAVGPPSRKVAHRSYAYGVGSGGGVGAPGLGGRALGRIPIVRRKKGGGTAEVGFIARLLASF